MANTDGSAEVNRVALKLPQFWEKTPELWFVNIEAQFRIGGITEDCTKYYAVIQALNAEVLMHVSDIALDPPKTEAYSTVKKRLISEFSDSEQKRLKTLISDLTLGDDKPSLLLRRMRQLAGTRLNDDLLQTLWLQRLPAQVQAILSVSEDTLDKLALMADKILEATENSPICYAIAHAQADTSTSNKQHIITPHQSTFAQNNEADAITQIKQQISELTKQVQSLTASQTSHRPRSRSGSRSRYTQQNNHGFCWYHYTFGQQAKKCSKPCSFINQEN